jgi:hypothetical protein
VGGSRLIQRIVVRLKVGEHRLSATDDPVFLGLRGPDAREFRLLFHKGKTLRRGADDRYVLGSPDDRETNVDHPELNDPTQPALDADRITSAYLRKALNPIPNVRGVGELDDRLEVHDIEVEFFVSGQTEPIRFVRQGPLWLGLVSGLCFEVPRADDGS